MRAKGRTWRAGPRTGSVCRIPLSGWRGDLHPDVREPTPAELVRRCPFCGQVPGPSATAWCPSLDQIILRAALAG